MFIAKQFMSHERVNSNSCNTKTDRRYRDTEQKVDWSRTENQ